ncbi:cilia- and flagella-associated protein 57 isoform X4 [Struthio camelus]|uniref:cilia- and flagella-associated protein 57 isoform X4 n=1 Tax=Struthio camelus TaxID=8801 RepID=UPI0036042517
MSVVVAQPVAIFGCRSQVAGGLCFFDEQILLYAAGANCVQFHIEQKWQKFIPGSEKSQGMQAMAISPNRRYLAISETVAEQPAVTVHEVSLVPSRRRRTLAAAAAELPVQEFVSLAFSPDSRYLAAATGPPEVHLAYWLWEKQRLMAAIRIKAPDGSLCQVSFSPQDNAQVCITGNGIFKLFRCSEGTLKATNLQKGEPQNYLCHAWLSAEKVVCGTDTGKLIIFESGEVRWETSVEYKIPPREAEEDATTKEPGSTLELYKQYQEEAYTVSLHPTGLFCLVGFSDKLRLTSLLYEDMHVFKEFTVRGCRECAFSNGGHLFAAVNGNVIHIYSTTTFENVNNLKGHSGKIRAVKWSADDAKLVSCDTHGAVYEWNLLTGKRESECVLRSCSYSSIALSPFAKITFAVGSDQTLKEISESSILHEVPAFDVVYTAIAVSRSGHMLFVGTSLGTIRTMRYPLPLPEEFNEYQAHAGPVTKMSVTNDDLFLLTASKDGSFLIWKVYDKEGQILKREKEAEYAEEVLIMRSDIEEKGQAMLDLQIRVKELQTENDYQLRLKDMNCNEKIKEIKEILTQEIDSLKTKYEILQAEKEKQELQHQYQLFEVMKKQARELQDLESGNNQKLLMENEKYQELQVKSQRMQEEYEKQLHDLEESKSKALEELTEYYEEKLNEKSVLLEETEETIRQQLQVYEEIKKQIEDDEDREIQEIKIRYERRLQEEKESNLRLKGETGIMRKRFNSLQKDIEERNSEIEEMKLEQQKLQGIITSLEKDILALKREIQERDDTIQDKEKRIYDLKKKNQELEKFKFVLDYKIKELKKQIQPRENDIMLMKEQIREMEGELERFHKQNAQLELNITELQQRLKATDREVHRERQKEQNMKALVKRFKTDLHNCVGFIQDSKKLKDGICELYTKYVHQTDMVETVGLDTDLQQEYLRQREYLERNLATLKKKVVKESEIHRADYVRIMQENVSLIKEINELRRELKVTRTQVHDLQSTLGLTKKKQVIRDPAPSSELLTSPAVLRLNAEKESEKIIEMQQLEIQRLRDQIQEKGQVLAIQPVSAGRLPMLNVEGSHRT